MNFYIKKKVYKNVYRRVKMREMFLYSAWSINRCKTQNNRINIKPVTYFSFIKKFTNFTYWKNEWIEKMKQSKQNMQWWKNSCLYNYCIYSYIIIAYVIYIWKYISIELIPNLFIYFLFVKKVTNFGHWDNEIMKKNEGIHIYEEE